MEEMPPRSAQKKSFTLKPATKSSLPPKSDPSSEAIRAETDMKGKEPLSHSGAAMIDPPFSQIIEDAGEEVAGEEVMGADRGEEAAEEEEEYPEGGGEVEEEGEEDEGGEGVWGDETKEVEEPIRGKRKQREYEVFVGGLDRDATEDDIEKVFKKVGEVVEVRLVKKPYSQQNKGFAFVRFATIEQAQRALTELRHTRVRGKSCGVIRSNDNETLHLGNICTLWSKDDLLEKLKGFELENLEEVHLIDDPRNMGKNRGYAFLDFSTHMDAVAACSKLQKRDFFLGTDVKAEVAFSKTVEPDEEFMAQVRSVFLDGLPSTWDANQVCEYFKKFGEIEHVQLASHMPTAKRKDFGFISFTTREAALNCIEKVNQDGIIDGAEKVSVKATLKKPLLKRVPPIMGFRRGGYFSRDFKGKGLQPYGIGRSYPSRPTRTAEFMVRGRTDRFGDASRVSSRGGDFRSTMSPMGKYGPHPRREFSREAPGPVLSRSRSGEAYLESSARREAYLESSARQEAYLGSSARRKAYLESSPRRASGSYLGSSVRREAYLESSPRRASGSYLGSSARREAYLESSPRRASGSYRHVSSTYSRSGGPYSDVDIYDPHFEHYNSKTVDDYDHPAFSESRLKRPYSDVDDDLLASNYLTKRGRSRSSLEMDAYPQRGVSEYDEYSRTLPDELFEYEKMDYASRGYGSRYMSGSGASRTYY